MLGSKPNFVSGEVYEIRILWAKMKINRKNPTIIASLKMVAAMCTDMYIYEHRCQPTVAKQAG